MVTAARILTVDEFLASIEEDDLCKYELSEGEVIRIGDAKAGHEKVKAKFNREFVRYTLANPIGDVTSESKYQLGDYTARQPDVSLLFGDRMNTADPSRLFQSAPDVAIEVVSSESASDLETKIRQYLAHGCKLVLVAYADFRSIHAHQPARRVRVFEADDHLEFPDLLPGFRVPVATFFEGA